MTMEVEGYQIGDLVWFVDKVLWPVLIRKKTLVQKVPDQTHPIQSKINSRIESFHQNRYSYEIISLPTDTNQIKVVFDYELLPFYYTTKPQPTSDILYNRALIQAVQVASSWAVPETIINREPLFDPVTVDYLAPPIQNPIHIGCPSVSGVYLKGKITQHMVEPRLIQQLQAKTSIIDLTAELLTQGISHWKHTFKSVQFHPPVAKKKLKQSPFPVLKQFEQCRIGSQIVRLGDYIVLVEEKVVKVEEIKVQKGVLCLNGLAIQQIKCRFDPCFEMNKFPVLDQTTWDGSTIVPQLYVTLK